MLGINFRKYLDEKMKNIPTDYNTKIPIWVLRITGAWRPMKKYSKIYLIWSTFMMTCVLGYLVLVQTAFVVAEVTRDAEKSASTVSLLFNNCVHVFKVYLIIRHRKRIQKLLDRTQERIDIFKDTEASKKIRYRYAWSSFTHYAFFQFTGVAACVSWTANSIAQSLRDKSNRVLPLNAWYPYDALVSPSYELTVACQAYTLFSCCFQNIAMDGFMIGYMAIIGCELEILKTKLKEIGDDADEPVGGSDYEKMNVLKLKKVDEKICRELALCVEHHIKIIECAREFQDIFHLAIFLQFMENCLVICMTAFAISQLTEYNMSTIMGNLSYLMAIGYQLFMYCYFGNVVAIQKNANMNSLEANFHVKMSLGINRWLGTWPPEGRYRWIYMFYESFSFLFILGILLIVQTVNLTVIWGDHDVEKIIAGSFLLMTNSSHALKVLNLLLRQNRIRALLEKVSSDTFSKYNYRYESILKRYTSNGIFHYIAYQSFGTVAVFCWGFGPVADLTAGRNRQLPMEGWYPYNVTKSPAFEFTCAHQGLAMLMGCFQNIGMDTLVTGLFTVVCCQLEILKTNISQIGANDSQQFSAKVAEEQLENCIKHHTDIIYFAREIEAIFSGTIAMQFFVNCIIICMTAFHITQMKIFIPTEVIGTTMYICCMTYQIFIYCWHGNEIVLHSESVVYAAFMGNWWRCGERYKRALRLLMVRANRPLVLKAGNILTLSLQTFVVILRASYSFFTVLQTSTDKS
ncbi:odorant receptor Or1-like [Athalia rosae]|uniref:odorant receptor Or1-like n=1 Tax=Athalia rosae TaxID=37344 RepID=UPI0020346EA8|nr:odorant receptor Or1-like [Athalia rosae]